MKTLFRYSFLLLNIALAFLLFLCRYIPRINPYDQPVVGILPYLVPALVMINVVYFFIWVFSKKYIYSLVPLVAVISSYGIWQNTFRVRLNPLRDTQKQANELRVMSYNVRLLDLYGWSGRKDTRDSMLAFFKQEQADILCLQEFYTGNDSIGVNNVKAIADLGAYPYWHLSITDENKRGQWGSILFSKFPIVKTFEHDIDVLGSNQLQQSDIDFQGDTLSVFNIHLRSNRFSEAESGLVEKPQDFSTENDTVMKHSKRILNKLFHTAIHRGLEAKLMAHQINRSKYPSLVCGDLNDIPGSYVYFQIRGKQQDAFLSGGSGLGATYIKTLPLLRIDYLFYPNNMTLTGFQNFDIPYSDHRPLMMRLRMH